ncbi:hypothetical protein TWF730_010277 [Orbilia blumenaviensis]|uniref:Uncharacterized protein n=1 Tax=Orbilia blumenaviensis TaxID=1796055 RepID=A0AAV9UMU9_9PEZI
MPPYPETPVNSRPRHNSPRFSSPDFWNETGEEIIFTPWEETVVTVTPGQKLDTILPKIPHTTKAQPPTSKQSSRMKKATPKTYKTPNRTITPCSTKSPMENKLPRKPMGKRVLPSPETLRVGRFEPVGYLDPMERAAEQPKTPSEPKKPANKNKPYKMPLTRAPSNLQSPLAAATGSRVKKKATLEKPTRPKKWFEDIDEDLLRRTKWARQLNQNSLQREYGNPGVLPEDRVPKKAPSGRTGAKDKAPARVNSSTLCYSQIDTKGKANQSPPNPLKIECVPPILVTPKPYTKAGEQKPTAKANITTAGAPKDKKDGFENFSFESFLEGELEILGSPFTGFDDFSFVNVSESGVELLRGTVATVQKSSIDKSTEGVEKGDKNTSFGDYTFEGVSISEIETLAKRLTGDQEPDNKRSPVPEGPDVENKEALNTTFADFLFEEASESEVIPLRRTVNSVQEDGSKTFNTDGPTEDNYGANDTFADLNSSAETRVLKTCLPTPDISFTGSDMLFKSNNDPEELSFRLRELDALRQGRNRALMIQMRLEQPGTPYVQVPKTQLIPEAVKDPETSDKATRSRLGKAKKRGRDEGIRADSGDLKRGKYDSGVRADRIRKPNKKDLERIPEVKWERQDYRTKTKRSKEETKERGKTNVDKALTREEAKRLARQNPGKQYVFDLDKPQD